MLIWIIKYDIWGDICSSNFYLSTDFQNFCGTFYDFWDAGGVSERIWVVLALGRFALSRFGQFLGWVVLALVGGSFRPIFGVSCFGQSLLKLIRYDRDRRGGGGALVWGGGGR